MLRTFLVAASLVSCPSLANTVGTDFQQFNPTTSGLDFVTVHSSETLQPGIANFGLFGNYAANTLPEFEDGKIERAPRGRIRNSILAGDFNLGIGLTSFMDFGISLPGTVFQSVEKKDQERIEYAARGLNEVRINAKLRMWGEQDHGIALIATTSFNTIEDNPMLGKDPEPTNAIEMAIDATIQKIAFAINAGYRWRTPGKPITGVPVTPFEDQFIYSGAISYHLPSADTKLVFEMFGGQASNDDPIEMQRLQKSAEGLWGLKTQVSRNMALHAGFGTYLEQAAVTPDYRVYGGINYTIGPVWAKPEQKVRKKASATLEPAVFDASAEQIETFVLDDINFSFDSDFKVLPGAMDTLQKVLQKLDQMKTNYKIIVEGHTDSFGTDEYNQILGLRRAEKVRAYLIKYLNLDPNKIEAVSFGESKPIADNGNFQGRQENRRVEIRIEKE